MKVTNITKSFGEKKVLSGFSFDFPKKGIVALKGLSGSGKTTLLRIIAGLEKADSGEVSENSSLSFAFQEPRLIRTLTALENVSFADPSPDRHERARKRLCALGLEDSLDEYPENLSGGMKTRVSLARALNHPAKIILLDEPYTGLDSTARDIAKKEVLEAAEKALVIIVSHDNDDFAPGTPEILL